MSKKITLSLVCILAVVGCAFAQSDQVRGSVVDENGAPIIGATVIVKDDPTIGTSTDLKGEFLLQIPEEMKNLILEAAMQDVSLENLELAI